MGFGFSVGDVAALGQIAWKIYKACKDAPESFKNVSQEVLSLHAVLKELEETYSGVMLSAARQSRLKILGDGCREVLEDLQCVLDKYNSLGTKTKRTWARLGWGSKDIAELRSRLISNTVLLTTFVNTSQVIVQEKLDMFLQDFRGGKYEGSIVSTETIDSLATDERQAWRAIRKELEDIGISVAAFDANKGLIVNWFKTAIGTGAFEEQPPDDGSRSILCENDLSQSLEDLEKEIGLSQSWEDVGNDTGLKSTHVEPQALKHSPKAKSQLRRPQQVAALSSWLDDTEDFSKAVQSGNETRVRQLLNRGADVNGPDEKYGNALQAASRHGQKSVVRLLLDEGADVNALGGSYGSALQAASHYGHKSIARMLLEQGADVNASGGDDGSSALQAASYYGHKSMVQLLLDKGADINASSGFYDRALQAASYHGHESVVRLLLDEGADVNASAGYHGSALQAASCLGHKSVVQLLLDQGADINASDGFYDSARRVASARGHTAVVQLLESHGC
ncbi:hypothetical protein MMC22_005953 [Lobaria immixta]|nr:hypothetical protein [Lobaria immixta]